MIIEGEDGITHINVYSKAKTDLGTFLSNFTWSPINIPEHGKFNSIEAYWYWLLCKDERLRNLYGYDAKSLGERLIVWDLFCEKDLHNDQNSEEFKNFIKQAITIKINNNPRYKALLAKSVLPLCHYYDFGGKRIDAKYEWIIEHIEFLRKELQQK